MRKIKILKNNTQKIYLITGYFITCFYCTSNRCISAETRFSADLFSHFLWSPLANKTNPPPQ